MNQREIKFRAWDKATKKMLRVNSLTFDFRLCDLWSGESKDEGVARNWADVVFMQFTGLKDKNGKEIYEGDICEMALTTPYGLIKHKGVMKFNEKSAQFGCDVETELENIADHIEQKEAPKVIGNIYENPELLK